MYPRSPAPIYVFVAAIFMAGSLQYFAFAQDPLSPKITAKQSGLTAADRHAVADYIAEWTSQLKRNDRAMIQNAKKMLLRPLESNPSLQFLQYYRQQMTAPLVETFEAAARAKHVLARINVMVIARRLRDPDGAALLIRGMKDGNIGVRYATVDAILRLTDGSVILDATETQQLRTVLALALDDEQAEHVVEKIIGAIVSLSIEDAPDIILHAIDRRIQTHFTRPTRSLAAETNGLQKLRNHIIHKPAVFKEETKRHFTHVVGRYFVMLVTVLNRDPISKISVLEYQSMLIMADESLKWMAKHFDIQELPALLNQHIDDVFREQNWQKHIERRRDAWINVLVDNLKFKINSFQIGEPRELAEERPKSVVPTNTTP